MTEAPAFAPDWVSPPGDTIADALEERGWTQAEFAERTGFSRKHVNELVHGRASITPESALKLELVLGAPARFWLTREAQYRDALERRRLLDVLERDHAWLKELPLAWMVRQGWIETFSHKGQQVAECLRYFGVASVDAWRSAYAEPLAAFRTSDRHEKKLGAVAAWLRQGELQAAGLRCASYDAEGFRAALGGLRALTNEIDPAVFIPQMVEVCAAHGVAVVFVPAPPGCPACGATRWLTPEKALLMLSLRYKSNDHLWFTFFHEAGHILKHSKKGLFLEGLEGMNHEKEAEADRFARDLLIPPEDAKALEVICRAAKHRGLHVSEADVRAFAARVQVAPGIVVGRMNNESWLPWTHLQGLKVRYRWAGEEDRKSGA